MAAVKRRPLQVASRRVVQDAKLAIRDVYDAIVELVTNADDRYQILGTEGRVEIELGRQGKGKPSILRVRDFADGMTTEQMNRKLGRIGGRVSGMEEGKAVRGTNSRGAKDIAALGKVTFESIAGDGRAHTCRIFPNLEYEADNSRRVTPRLLVFRARKQFRSGRDRFRLGGILVKSRHAIHEATLFDRGLEWDSNAQWFHGRLGGRGKMGLDRELGDQSPGDPCIHAGMSRAPCSTRQTSISASVST